MTQPFKEPAGVPKSKAMELRLASYNVHKCLGTDRRRDPGRVADVLHGIGADVVALQEVDHRRAPRPEALPAWIIEGRTDFVPLPFAIRAGSLGWHGQTILIRKALRCDHIQRLVLPGLEPRGAVLAEVALPGGAHLRVVGVHLGLFRRYRMLQLKAIRLALERLSPLPTVILGDFNEWSRRGGSGPLDDLFRLHVPGRSFHSRSPMAGLDRVALGPGLHLRDAGVIGTDLARRASDHLPIWADIRMDAA